MVDQIFVGFFLFLAAIPLGWVGLRLGSGAGHLASKLTSQLEKLF